VARAGVVVFKLKFLNEKVFLKNLKRVDPKSNPKIVSSALIDMANRVARDAATNQIIRSGQKGVVDPKRITSRTGNLRGSLSPRYAVNRSGLPRYIEVGSYVEYSRIHEQGGWAGQTGARFIMPKRPFLAPALEEVSTKFEEIFIKHWAKESGLGR